MRFLIVVLVLCWALGLLFRAIGWVFRNLLNSASLRGNAEGSNTVQDTAAARRLVRDPVCGVHVAEARAIPLRDGGELIHFCSAACRDKYVGERKLAANG